MDMQPIVRAIPKPEGKGRRSTIRMRSDVGEVVADLVLQRRTKTDIAKRLGVNFTTVDRFQKEYVTEEVRRIVMLQDQRAQRAEEDKELNEGQDEIKQGLRSIIAEQKEILAKVKAGDDHGTALMALRDQSATWERLLKTYTALQDKTTIVLSINESPEWSQLQAVLFDVFEAHPDAFADFERLVREKRLRLE